MQELHRPPTQYYREDEEQAYIDVLAGQPVRVALEALERVFNGTLDEG